MALVAQLGSVIGDQLARVALAILVFDRTGSAGLSALTYALTFLPDIAGGPLLSGLADRFPRRRVMVTCDAARAVLVALMAIPGAPVVDPLRPARRSTAALAPFQSARAAMLATIMTGDKYGSPPAVDVTAQSAQLVGFVTGGTLVATFGAAKRCCSTPSPSRCPLSCSSSAYRSGRARDNSGQADLVGFTLSAGARLVWHDKRLRYLAPWPVSRAST